MLAESGGPLLLYQVWLAARVGAWLSFLPILMRTRPLPQLLEQLATGRKPSPRGGSVDFDDTIQVVTRVCQMRVFRLPIFPRACLRRSLALYYFLGRSGHPIEIHIGVRKDGHDLHGHCWVALEGRVLRERDPAQVFNTIYSCRFAAYPLGAQST